MLLYVVDNQEALRATLDKVASSTIPLNERPPSGSRPISSASTVAVAWVTALVALVTPPPVCAYSVARDGSITKEAINH